ncbi:OLC1v1019579C1 [Oldenlandia corymbosa var. corymbosa]|uniref:OLC1v1019579C1 n=1 Tax=Oldenlandia corymbosa var. corymbosa TaxID=529605 RepID=A0AAV1EEH6_OLDCO|nr:OLC1v1019579C1 [Oldenlandia corymbosa var. corymbosa]
MKGVEFILSVLAMTDSWEDMLNGKEVKYGRQEGGSVHFKRTRNASPTWKGVFDAFHLVLKGTTWVIGNGRTVRFWEDQWIEGVGRLSDHIVNQVPVEWKWRPVADFASSNGSWDVAKFAPFLPAEVVIRISSIPPPMECLGSDRPRWMFDRSGKFSVKSAYLLANDDTHLQVDRDWERAWRWKGPQRIRTFLWLALHGRFPTSELCKQRGASDSEMCLCCHGEVESTLHALRDCQLAREVWMQVVPESRRRRFFHQHAKEWFRTNLEADDFKWRMNFGSTCWLLWNCRNDRVFNGATAAVGNIVRSAVHKSEEIARSQNLLRWQQSRSNRVKELGWKKPPSLWQKVNCDAAVCLNSGKAAVGGIIRDDASRFMVAFNKNEGICSVETVELRAILLALQVAKQRGIPRVVVESDSQLAIEQVNRLREEARTPFDPELRSILTVLQGEWEVQFLYTCRENNLCADTLAKQALDVYRGVCFFDDPPGSIAVLVEAELSSPSVLYIVLGGGDSGISLYQFLASKDFQNFQRLQRTTACCLVIITPFKSVLLYPPLRRERKPATSKMEYWFSDHSSPETLENTGNKGRSLTDSDGIARRQRRQNVYRSHRRGLRNYSWEKMQTYVGNNWDGQTIVLHKVKNFFVFKFNSREILKMVLYSSPFTVDGGLLVLSRWYPNMSLDNLRIERISMGICLYGLHVECTSGSYATKMARMIGDPLSVRASEMDARKATYLREKVAMKPYDPLSSGFYLDLWNGDNIWIKCSCDRLYKFCQRCGLVGHAMENCSIDRNEKLDQYLDVSFGLNGAERNMDCKRDEQSNLFPMYMRMTEGQVNKKSTQLSPEYIHKHYHVFRVMREEDILDGFVYSNQLDGNSGEQAHISFDLELIKNHRRYAVQKVGHDLNSNDNMQIDSLEPVARSNTDGFGGFGREDGLGMVAGGGKPSVTWGQVNNMQTNTIRNKSIRSRANMAETRIWSDPQITQSFRFGQRNNQGRDLLRGCQAQVSRNGRTRLVITGIRIRKRHNGAEIGMEEKWRGKRPVPDPVDKTTFKRQQRREAMMRAVLERPARPVVLRDALTLAGRVTRSRQRRLSDFDTEASGEKGSIG